MGKSRPGGRKGFYPNLRIRSRVLRQRQKDGDDNKSHRHCVAGAELSTPHEISQVT